MFGRHRDFNLEAAEKLGTIEEKLDAGDYRAVNDLLRQIVLDTYTSYKIALGPLKLIDSQVRNVVRLTRSHFSHVANILSRIAENPPHDCPCLYETMAHILSHSNRLRKASLVDKIETSLISSLKKLCERDIEAAFEALEQIYADAFLMLPPYTWDDLQNITANNLKSLVEVNKEKGFAALDHYVEEYGFTPELMTICLQYLEEDELPRTLLFNAIAKNGRCGWSERTADRIEERLKALFTLSAEDLEEEKLSQITYFLPKIKDKAVYGANQVLAYNISDFFDNVVREHFKSLAEKNIDMAVSSFIGIATRFKADYLCLIEGEELIIDIGISRTYNFLLENFNQIASQTNNLTSERALAIMMEFGSYEERLPDRVNSLVRQELLRIDEPLP